MNALAGGPDMVDVLPRRSYSGLQALWKLHSFTLDYSDIQPTLF